MMKKSDYDHGRHMEELTNCLTSFQYREIAQMRKAWYIYGIQVVHRI